ncbi:pyruvate decarboxylase-like protein [Hyaloscypha variabilis F]|uniref:Pyruvate decarboxylase n=1 Tax=Hyaloscypha variabilis (strain UAMH 11265 / GT02V1 / F) TaxID=1149755 RepID=A0A2J6RVJ6_HYAVF|nr:pyruvate decarboxylase-like protein [Hyaloscypha variabilis F]
MADIRTSALKSPVDVAEYLFTRLHQIGVRSVHGVPGDFNLVALDYIPQTGLKWVGNCNELNAGYAADGYARVKGMSAIVTTFGVGELSVVNAIAGAFSEHVPVVHIVGTPSTISQKDGMLLHHTLGNGNFNVFADMNREISCAMARLNSPDDAASLIDYNLQQCWIQSRPVYVTLPTDIVQKKIEGERLKTPIDLHFPTNDQAREDYCVDVVLKYLHAAKNPIILVDACAIRHRVLDEVHDLISVTGLPVFVTPMGKGAVNETHPNYGGVYAGEGSQPEVKDRVEASDLILTIGAIKSDFNTAGFSYKTSQLNTIDFHSTHITVRYSEYPGLHMRGVLRKVINQIDKKQLSAIPGPKMSNKVKENEDNSETITQAWFWPRVGQFLKENDIVITETGTANFGIWETKFPKGVTAISQVLWGSIGYSVGACQGACLAARDASTDRRTILFVGDGSFQLTAQELSTMIRLGLNPIIFVICNEGYTIERFIHGMDEVYNDIQPWHFKDLVNVFGAKEGESRTYQIKTKEQANQLLEQSEFNSANVLQFVELYMPKKDAPRALVLTADASAKNNARQ